MRERRRQHLLAVGLLDKHVVLVAGPVHTRVPIRHPGLPSGVDCASQRPDLEVALRALIDGPSTGLRPVAACGTSPRREEQVSSWPYTGLAPRALTQRESRQPEDDQ
jgi:hypothetical protein